MLAHGRLAESDLNVLLRIAARFQEATAPAMFKTERRVENQVDILPADFSGSFFLKSIDCELTAL